MKYKKLDGQLYERRSVGERILLGTGITVLIATAAVLAFILAHPVS